MDQSFYEKILDAMTDGVYFVNRKRQILYWNKAAEELSGYKADEVLGKCCAENTLQHVDDAGTHLCFKGCPLSASMRDGEPRETHVYMHHKSGFRMPVHIRSFPTHDENGRVTGAVEIFKDDRQHRAMISEVETLRQEVLTDPLTGIGNRRYADITLESYEAGLVARGIPFGVIIVDVDNFKSINDTWGHKLGDRVIKTVAQTLLSALRPRDIACRWGGDEYVILIPEATKEGVSVIGRRLLHLIKESWIELETEAVTFSASIGGALAQPGDTVAFVMEQADQQLYRCKEDGRNCFYFNGSKYDLNPRIVLTAC
ncbi:PAS domain S-box-containing protein/diguanylate cyclase (GGDEF) domain-containing protein [Cohaesibacter sp. ES.047]|uniref:sensor domain-containing diguanylate cyclase n=1 Tax=Cohaesibacter sp. ES.047 TaxID=1798205 RepID=UPI000BB9763C|nr:sensor domain-containing diguanylate cyclase [Cohaesibacter sp. ES.047]SNY91565.1 PAS domain S-box-containing protein/diguanylate cyclase (GGDEF) domain-containing protein [Cohaesibacter sp. ES.047]